EVIPVDVILALIGVALSIGALAWSSWQHNKKVLASLQQLPAADAPQKMQILESLRPDAARRNVRDGLQQFAAHEKDHHVKAKANEVVNNPPEDPSKPLISIFPRWAVVALALISFILIFSILYLSIFQSDLIKAPMPRAGFIVAISFFMS